MNEQPAATFEGLLRSDPAFRDIGDDRLGWLASRARPFHCTVGQELLRLIASLSFVSALSKAVAAYSTRSWLAPPVTLAYSHPGDLVGWSGLVHVAAHVSGSQRPLH